MPVKHGKYRWLELLIEQAVTELFPLIVAGLVIGGIWLVFHV